MTALFWCALGAQVVFAAGLGTCVAIAPSYVLGANQGGVSNYGSDRRTVVPFAMSFGGNAALMAAAAAVVPDGMDAATWLRAGLSLLALLLIALLVSAWVYKRSELLRKLHFAVGIALLAYESVLSLWLLVFVASTWAGWLLWAAMLAADALCILAITRVVEKLFIGQVVANLAFGAVLLTTFA